MKTWMELAGPLALAAMAIVLGAFTFANMSF